MTRETVKLVSKYYGFRLRISESHGGDGWDHSADFDWLSWQE